MGPEFFDAVVGGKKLIDEMQIPGKLNSGKAIKYAGGLFVDKYRGLKTVSHTGFHGGYKTVILRFPDERFSVIVLANVRDFVPIRMAKRIADIYLTEKLEPQQKGVEVKGGGDMEPFLGEYRFGQSLWRVAKDAKGSPFVQVEGGEKKRLVATTDGKFFDREDGTLYAFTKKKDDVELETLAETTPNRQTTASPNYQVRSWRNMWARIAVPNSAPSLPSKDAARVCICDAEERGVVTVPGERRVHCPATRRILLDAGDSVGSRSRPSDYRVSFIDRAAYAICGTRNRIKNSRTGIDA